MINQRVIRLTDTLEMPSSDLLPLPGLFVRVKTQRQILIRGADLRVAGRRCPG
ncbi:hypothetical protein BDV24DRAFT_124231 [Aspergillus arachidicola]|uniref:Uncharacterized protein n=1 Tax=Aspergillus arachidicola TaxID=656916 RepID=A0A5N6YLJ4_9EURO|nr:hypothetical protein BDV24DRAFT_124231 [Aspergillus arachidicola]